MPRIKHIQSSGEYCKDGFENAWFEVGPFDDKNSVRALVNLVTNTYLVKTNAKWTQDSNVLWMDNDIVEGLQYINPANLTCKDVPIKDALSAKFYNQLCASQGFDQI